MVPVERNGVDADGVRGNRCNRAPVLSGYRRGYLYADTLDVSGSYHNGSSSKYVEEDPEDPQDHLEDVLASALEVEPPNVPVVAPVGTCQSPHGMSWLKFSINSELNFPPTCPRMLAAILVTKVTNQPTATTVAGLSSAQPIAATPAPATNKEQSSDPAMSSPNSEQAENTFKAESTATPKKGD